MKKRWINHKYKEKARSAIEDNKNVSRRVLPILFSRLYLLRNQIFHGFSTFDSGNNRDSVIKGSCILQNFVPLFIDIMMENANEDWGKIAYHPDGK